MKHRAWLIAALAALAFAAACRTPVEAPHEEHAEAGHEEPEAEESHVELTAEALKIGGVVTGQVMRRAIQTQLEVPGTVSTPGNRRAVVTPPVAGKVVRLYANLGDLVGPGQPLAEIQSGDLALASSAVASAETAAVQAAAAVRQQSSAVDLARGRLRTALASLGRQRQFAVAGAFSQPSLTAAQNELNESQTEGASAQSELAAARSRLARADRLSVEGLVSAADFDQARLDVRQAEIRVERARRRIALAEQTFQREARVRSQGLLNAREIQSAEADARAAKLEVDQARIALQAATSALSGAQRAVQNARLNETGLRGGAGGKGSSVLLTAPIAGVITERLATLGQAVERSSDLFDIEDLSTVWVTASVPEADVSRVSRGATVTVTTSAYPGQTFRGSVHLIGARLDPKTRTLPVQCEVANPQRRLRPGLFARVRIATAASITSLAIPNSAVVGEGDQQAVFREEGGKFERRTVKTGRTDGAIIEINEGLALGDRVAVAGVFTLQSELQKAELKGHDH